MLIDVDFGALAGYLNPNKAKLASKGVASVVSRVMNLKTIVPLLDHQIWYALCMYHDNNCGMVMQ
jgi:lipoate-protein ligase A